MENINYQFSRQRKMATKDSQPRLFSHVRLRYEPVRNAVALLSPEKVFWPDETGLAIFKLCNGKRTISEIAQELAEEYQSCTDEIAEDIIEFIQHWSDQLLVKL